LLSDRIWKNPALPSVFPQFVVRDFFHKKLSEKNATLKEVVLEYVIETIKQQLNKEKNVMNLIAYV